MDRSFSSPAFDVVDRPTSVPVANGGIARLAPLSDPGQIVAELRAKILSGQLGPDSIQQIVQAAYTLSGAEGAALAMRQNDSVFCTARAGDMAPDLGSELSPNSGISGQCLRSGGALRCGDTSTDTRVDAEACRQLGLRSIAVAAIGKTPRVSGILEAFSPAPYAFSDAHVQLLVELADLVMAAQGAQPKPADLITADQPASGTGRRWKLIVPAAAVVATGLLVFVGWPSFKKKAPLPHPSKVLAQPVPVAASVVTKDLSSGLEKPAPGVQAGHAKTGLLGSVTIAGPSEKISGQAPAGAKTASESDAGTTSPTSAPGNPPEAATAPSVALVSAENKPELAEILTPSNALPIQPALKASKLTGGTLDRRVEPIYPPQALKFRLEGEVSIQAVVKQDGSVRGVKVIGGNLLLARAATDAVAQWHFRPFMLNGQPIEMTTTVRLTFKLP